MQSKKQCQMLDGTAFLGLREPKSGLARIAYNPGMCLLALPVIRQIPRRISRFILGGIFRRCFKREKDCTFYIKVL